MKRKFLQILLIALGGISVVISCVPENSSALDLIIDRGQPNFMICKYGGSDTAWTDDELYASCGDTLVLKYFPKDAYRNYDYIVNIKIEKLISDEDFDSIWNEKGSITADEFSTRIDSLTLTEAPYKIVYSTNELSIGEYSFNCHAYTIDSPQNSGAIIEEYGGISVFLE